MRSLLYRLILLNLAIFVVTMVVILLARQFIDPDNTPYQQIRVTVAHSLELEDPAALTAQVDRLGRTVDARLSVYSPEGELLASSVEPPLAMRESDLGMFGGYVDIESEGGEVQARVVMAPSLDSFARQLSRDLLIVCFVVCLLALLVVIWATRRVSAPLETLVDAARRFGRGELDARAALEREDEIGEVGQAFDEMAARLSLLMRSQRELLANVSHEFRTPLARMRVVSEMLAEGDDVRELLPELDTDIGELERLVEGVLESAALDLRAASPAALEASGASGSRTAAIQELGADELLERVGARFALAHAERELRLELPDEGLPRLRVELDALLRGFDNLLENAHRYSPADEAIVVRGARRGRAPRRRDHRPRDRHRGRRSSADLHALLSHGSQPGSPHGRARARPGHDQEAGRG